MLKFVVLLGLLASCLGSEPAAEKSLDGKIVGGHSTTIQEWPFMLSLQVSYLGGMFTFHQCGASIIGSNWAITAAHCTEGMSASSLVVRAGSTNRYSGGSTHQVAQIIEHSGYGVGSTYNNDVAVFRGASQASFLVGLYRLSASGERKGTFLIVADCFTGLVVIVEGLYGCSCRGYDMSLSKAVVKRLKQNVRMILGPNSTIQFSSVTKQAYVNILGMVKVGSMVSTPFVFSNNVQPVNLASNNLNLAGGTYTKVAGWGALAVRRAGSRLAILPRGATSIRSLSDLFQSGGSSPDTLMEVSLPVVTNTQCAQIYGSSSITTSMLCAGYLAGGKDSCQGDSGGPLVVGGVQVGIVSWGGECAAVGIAGVYVRVSAIRDWVWTNTGI
uniref:Peptidase S1 domain-containing protein n=1 Tax=Timema shepardi TaxID=629360 RepID=A0A7R9G5X4_TIMSH|nr:unnamed protein product [Timema shepardi]